MKHEFKKGHKGYKPKGAISHKSKAWEQLGDFITEAGAERVKTILASCEAEDFVKYYTLLLEYFKPKLARTENKNETKVEGSLNLNVLSDLDIEEIKKL